MNKRKILIVEDQDGIRNLISATLRMKGFVIEKAENGKEALKMLNRSPNEFDLIVSDFDMPRMNGQEFLSEVRSTTELKDKPFIMLTSHSEFSKIKEAKEKGISEWIVKPFKVDSFVSKIEYALKKA